MICWARYWYLFENWEIEKNAYIPCHFLQTKLPEKQMIFFTWPYWLDSELLKNIVRLLISDIDECAEEGGKNGHHCLGKTKCVNTIGSYKCQCANGHDHTDDPYTCEGTSNLKTATPTVILICLCLILCQSLRKLHWM